MTTIDQLLTDWMRESFRKALPEVESDWAAVTIVATTNAEFGDYQCNFAMGLAKVLKKAPRQIAEAVVNSVAAHEAVHSVAIAGPGFINITLATGWLARKVSEAHQDERCGVPQIGKGKAVILDYSSPNVAKPMHIGHIRSTVIGNALDRLHRYLGYHVLSDNHLGDWGTQFGIMIMGYRNFADAQALAAEPVEELERVYVKSYEQSKKDESWLQQARQELVKLQAGDPDNRRLWQQFIELSLQEFDHIYKRLDVKFDLIRGESYYNDKLAGVVQNLVEKGLARESEGALVAFLDDEKLPPCIVRKSDGGFNYATTDLATIESRVSEFHPDKIIYVTVERQQLHF